MAKSGTVKTVKEKTKQFLADRKNANNLIEIISMSSVSGIPLLLIPIHV